MSGTTLIINLGEDRAKKNIKIQCYKIVCRLILYLVLHRITQISNLLEKIF